jgi:hypothetical protein
MGILTKCRRLWADDAGSTLVEAVVAVSLIIVVLTPMIGAFVYQAGQHRSEQLTQALALGQRRLEALAAWPEAAPDSVSTLEGRWRVVSTARREGRLVALAVAVYDDPATTAFLTLRTHRFVP